MGHKQSLETDECISASILYHWVCSLLHLCNCHPSEGIWKTCSGKIQNDFTFLCCSSNQKIECVSLSLDYDWVLWLAFMDRMQYLSFPNLDLRAFTLTLLKWTQWLMSDITHTSFSEVESTFGEREGLITASTNCRTCEWVHLRLSGPSSNTACTRIKLAEHSPYCWSTKSG